MILLMISNQIYTERRMHDGKTVATVERIKCEYAKYVLNFYNFYYFEFSKIN